MRMKYDEYLVDRPGFWEHAWISRPYPSAQHEFPLVLIGAGNCHWLAGGFVAREDSPLFAVEYVCAGNMTFIQDAKGYLVQSHDVFLLRRGSTHRYATGPAGVVLKRFIQIAGPGLDYFLKLLGLWDLDHIRVASPARLSGLFKQVTTLLSNLTRNSAEPADIQLSCLAYRLLLELTRTSQPLLPASVKKAITFVHENLHRHVSRQEICDHIGTSSASFSRLFKSCVGCSPMKYFLDQKFTWTAHLLKSTPLSVKEIGYQAGFEDPFYFSAQFKKHFGMSPLQYRQAEAPEIPLEADGVFTVSRAREN